MDARLPDAFCEFVVSLLPTQEPPGRRGGRPAIPHAVVLKVIWFVLTVGCRWKDIPREFGCYEETARRRLKHWQELGVWQNVHLRLLALLNQRGRLGAGIVLIDSTHVRAFGGGDRSGPSPVDRRKPGTKLTLLTDRRGTPLVLRSAPAHCRCVSLDWRTAGTPPSVTRPPLRRCRIRQPIHSGCVVGTRHRLRHSLPQPPTRFTPGPSPLARRTHLQLDQGPASHANPL